MSNDPFPVACVVLGGADPSALAEAVRLAAGVGAAPVVVPLPAGVARPAGAQVVTTAPGATGIGALRRAMAALANTPAVGLLLWETGRPGSARVARTVVEAARRTGAPIVIPEDGGRALTPTWYARDTWLELMTVGEQGLDAVHRRHESALQRVEVPDAMA